MYVKENFHLTISGTPKSCYVDHETKPNTDFFFFS